MSSFDIANITGPRINSISPLREKDTPGSARPAPEAPATPANTGQRDATSGGVNVETGSIASLAGANAAPIDTNRVAAIRSALENGSYPINPTEIADAMIAAKLMLIVTEGTRG